MKLYWIIGTKNKKFIEYRFIVNCQLSMNSARDNDEEEEVDEDRKNEVKLQNISICSCLF